MLRAACLLALVACSGDEVAAVDAPMQPDDAAPGDASIDADTGPCPADMQPVGAVCMDRFEAPNAVGEQPLVMYTFVEAEAWCAARSKRLCFDDEWQTACEGAGRQRYPYGDTHTTGACNDGKTWRAYTQSLLNGWPSSAAKPTVTTLAQLLAAATSASTAGSNAANHVLALYQGTAAGAHPECAGDAGVRDLVGNVEEWTRRRDGGMTLFHGSLKGRYWAEARTCQSAVTSHGDNFRFYEIGFRCCREP